MPKGPNINISFIAVLRLIIFSLIGLLIFCAYSSSIAFLTSSKIFEVKDVLIDSSIQFIDVSALKQLKGRNIFKVDINKIERQITAQYPYISQLRIVRDFPDHILVLAKKREPLFQCPVRGKFLLVDTEGVALYYSNQPIALTQVRGIPLERMKYVLGTRIPGVELDKTVQILNIFKTNPFLTKWHVSLLEAGNLSKINLSFGENLQVILDQENIEDKINTLQMLIEANKINLNLVKYIDLRFEEPVIASNVQEEDSKE